MGYSSPPWLATNRLQGSAATMSTTYSASYAASYCVNGVTASTTDFCSTGASDTEPWFSAPSASPLTSLAVYPRNSGGVCCAGRMAGALIDTTSPFLGLTQVNWGVQLNASASQSTPHLLALPAYSLRLSKPTGYAGDAPYPSLAISLSEVAVYALASSTPTLNLLAGQTCRYNARASGAATSCALCTDGSTATSCDSAPLDTAGYLLFAINATAATPATALSITLTPRQDGGLFTRASGLYAEVLNASTGAVLWSAVVPTLASPAPVTLPPPLASEQLALRLSKPLDLGPYYTPGTNEPTVLSFGEIGVSPAGNVLNLLLYSPLTMSSHTSPTTYPGFNCVDGSPSSFCHSDPLTDSAPNLTAPLPQGALPPLGTVVLWPRTDCCAGRASQTVVDLVNLATGLPIWGTQLGNVSGAAPIYLTLPTYTLRVSTPSPTHSAWRWQSWLPTLLALLSTAC